MNIQYYRTSPGVLRFYQQVRMRTVTRLQLHIRVYIQQQHNNKNTQLILNSDHDALRTDGTTATGFLIGLEQVHEIDGAIQTSNNYALFKIRYYNLPLSMEIFTTIGTTFYKTLRRDKNIKL